MEELAEVLNCGDDYSERVVAAFNRAMRCIMDATCYELTPTEFNKQLHFTIPAGRDHDIIVTCTHEELLSVKIATTWQLQMGCELPIDVEKPNKVKVTINEKKLMDVRWLNPGPAIRHCRQLVQDLNLPSPQADTED
jgi:hypothetical protein